MVFWYLAIAITAIACAALYYAGAGRPVNAVGMDAEDATREHFRLQLRELDTDLSVGRMGRAEALAAKGEMGREVMRLAAEAKGRASPQAADRRPWAAGAVLATAVLAIGTYSVLGHPDLPSLPLATRPDLAVRDMTLDDAVKKIEAELRARPDDLKGWSVLGPIYMQLGRFGDAATAFRRINVLAPPTAASETNLAEALMMSDNGAVGDEAKALLRSAAGRDPSDLRSRYYLAGELNRTGDFKAAIAAWTALLGLGQGDAAWVAAAEAGLAAATAGLSGVTPAPDQAAIRQMVDGLSARLLRDGGTLEEWTRLVRSRLVLGEPDKAQAAYAAARTAYPDAAERAALDVLAADNALTAKGPVR